MRSTAPILLQPVLGQFASPYFVLGRQQRSTYIQVLLALLAPSGLVWLATWPRTRSGGVSSHGLHNEGSRRVQVLHVHPLVDGMDIAHPAAQVGDLEPPLREDIRIGAAPRGPRRQGATDPARRLGDQPDDGRLIGHVEALILPVYPSLEARPVQAVF